MKNASWFYALLTICSLGCGGKDDNCESSISSIQPNSNPPGYEVLITTNGFDSDAKVFFGTVEATTRIAGANAIIAKVPSGVSGNNIEVSVEGDCIARSDGFTVLGTLPNSIQASLQEIIIPTPPPSYPTDIGNNWKNAANDNQSLLIQGSLVGGVAQLDIDSKEFNYGVESPLSGTINTNTNVIYMEIDRRAIPNGILEHFDGQFIPLPKPDPATTKPYAILLISRETGRQSVFLFPG